MTSIIPDWCDNLDKAFFYLVGYITADTGKSPEEVLLELETHFTKFL